MIANITPQTSEVLPVLSELAEPRQPAAIKVYGNTATSLLMQRVWLQLLSTRCLAWLQLQHQMTGGISSTFDPAPYRSRASGLDSP
jgi:hypothetical protein